MRTRRLVPDVSSGSKRSIVRGWQRQCPRQQIDGAAARPLHALQFQVANGAHADASALSQRLLDQVGCLPVVP
jgi:hypothetical protein